MPWHHAERLHKGATSFSQAPCREADAEAERQERLRELKELEELEMQRQVRAEQMGAVAVHALGGGGWWIGVPTWCVPWEAALTRSLGAAAAVLALLWTNLLRAQQEGPIPFFLS
jgi:hypothetical protein